MAKNKSIKARRETGREITTPSAYGSHRSMCVSPKEYGLTLQNGEVLCQDGDRLYITYENRLDTGLADPKRYSGQSIDA